MSALIWAIVWSCELDLSNFYSKQTRIVENASLCSGVARNSNLENYLTNNLLFQVIVLMLKQNIKFKKNLVPWSWDCMKIEILLSLLYCFHNAIDGRRTFFHCFYIWNQWRYKKNVLTSFEHLYKLYKFSKLGGFGSKIMPATPILVLEYK